MAPGKIRLREFNALKHSSWRWKCRHFESRYAQKTCAERFFFPTRKHWPSSSINADANLKELNFDCIVLMVQKSSDHHLGYVYIYINSPVNHGRFQPPTSTGDVIARFRMNHQTVSLVQNFDCIVGLHWKDIFWSEGVTRTMVTNQWSLTAGSLTLFACFLLLFEIRLLEHLDVFPPCFIQFSYLLSWSEPPQKTPKFSGSKIQQYNRLYIFWTSSIFFTKTWAERFFWSHPGRSMPRRGRSSMLQLKKLLQVPKLRRGFRPFFRILKGWQNKKVEVSTKSLAKWPWMPWKSRKSCKYRL